jgi:hypothetical protein
MQATAKQTTKTSKVGNDSTRGSEERGSAAVQGGRGGRRGKDWELEQVSRTFSFICPSHGHCHQPLLWLPPPCDALCFLLCYRGGVRSSAVVKCLFASNCCIARSFPCLSTTTWKEHLGHGPRF